LRPVLALLLAVVWSLGGTVWAAEGEPSAPTPPGEDRPAAPAATKPAAPAPNTAPSKDADYVLRAALSTRGPDDSRIGIALAAEMRSPLPWGLEGGPGLEVDLWQSQRDSNVISFLPIYWALDYRPIRRYPNAFLSGRFGFDILGQEGDDTLAGRSYYALGIGLVTHSDRPKKLLWELSYSRMQGAFPGVAFSVGSRF
jgi:hypothetical protein